MRSRFSSVVSLFSLFSSLSLDTPRLSAAHLLCIVQTVGCTRCLSKTRRLNSVNDTLVCSFPLSLSLFFSSAALPLPLLLG